MSTGTRLAARHAATEAPGRVVPQVIQEWYRRGRGSPLRSRRRPVWQGGSPRGPHVCFHALNCGAGTSGQYNFSLLRSARLCTGQSCNKPPAATAVQAAGLGRTSRAGKYTRGNTPARVKDAYARCALVAAGIHTLGSGGAKSSRPES